MKIRETIYTEVDEYRGVVKQTRIVRREPDAQYYKRDRTRDYPEYQSFRRIFEAIDEYYENEQW